jgi:hypothetical protein
MSATKANLAIGCFALGALLVVLTWCTGGCQPAARSNDRRAFMRSVDASLMNYASDHDGWLPSDSDPFAALAKLYPDYCDAGNELAGLSGGIDKVTAALRDGKSISNLTSWVYVPSLRITDYPRIAVLWESKIGLDQSGRKSSRPTRPVLLLDRSITNVLASDWDSFLAEQASLLRNRQTNQAGNTK